MIEADDAAGRGARSPFQVPAEGWLAVFKRTWKEVGDDQVGIIAAGIAFYAFAAIVPLLGAVVLSYGLFADADTVRRNVESIFAAVPREAATIISQQLLNVVESSKDKQGLGLLVAIALAYYGATKGAGAIITGLNVVYDTRERRGFVRLTLVQLGVVAGGVAMILLAIVTTTVLGFLEGLIPHAPGAVIALIRVAGYVILAGLVVTAAALLFRFGPDHRQPHWRWLSPGSAGATALWLGGTALFGVYVTNFGNYGATYGSLSAVVVLLTWLWLSAYIFLVGAELNAELERQVDGAAAAAPAPTPDAATGPVTPPAPAVPVAEAAGRVASRSAGVAMNGLVATAGFALLRRGRPIGVAIVAAAAVHAWRSRPGKKAGPPRPATTSAVEPG